jgi:hypothetical protein
MCYLDGLVEEDLVGEEEDPGLRRPAAVRPHPVADQAAHRTAAQLSRHLLGQAHSRYLPRLAAHDQLILRMKTNCS